MDQLDTMRIFSRVAELGSFTEAGSRLGLPKASVSGAVQRLERQLNVRLLQRTTRRVQMTPEGQAFYERCRDLLADVDEMQAMFQQHGAELTGRLRVDMPTGLAKNLMPRIPEFLRAHPALEIELSSTDRRVDLMREGFDCVIRVGALQDSSLIARPLGYFRMVNCVSPGYLAQYGEPTFDTLPQHRLVHYVPILGGRSSGFEYVDTASGETRFMTMPGALTVNESEAYRAACLAGLGIIQVPVPGVRDELARGTLVEVLREHRAESMPVNLLYVNRSHLPRRVRVFMDWVGEVTQPLLTQRP
ncbi:MAG TPA: LysR family transcriptional regulator [Lysobacter sp.]|nr:LysR family transcriptional regulator [Lysobacter sp.]